MNGQKRILVVDDEPKICHLIKQLLEKEGYLADASSSGMEALQMMKKQNYQILLTDLKMPEIDGLELIRKVKKEYPDIRTIMITAYATVKAAVQSLRYGVDDFITKPFNIFELKDSVKKTLHIHQIAMESKQFVKDLEKTNNELDFTKQELTVRVHMTGKHLEEANKKLIQRINELDTINEISKAITSVLDMDELLNLCLKEINEKLKVKQSTIMLVDDVKNELIVKACQGHRRHQILGKTQKIGEGIAGRVAKYKKAILVKDIDNDIRFKDIKKPTYKTKSFVSAPLILEKRLLGVINIIDKVSGESFCETDVNLLCTIAGQVCVALENARLYKRIEENCFNTIKSLATSLEAKDYYTSGHSQRVAEYSGTIAEMLGLSSKEKDTLKHAALLHDIGKIGISEQILNKPAKLDVLEFNMIKTHPVTGEKIIEPLDFLKESSNHIRSHHESFDGCGYPDRLGGDDIPVLARIMSIADAFDAMTSERIYRPAKKVENAISEINRVSGRQFDPEVVDAFTSSETVKIMSDLETNS